MAIFDDYGITIWWIVYGVWTYNGTEDWEARFTRPDGSYKALHWRSYMDPVSGLKCFQSSDPLTGATGSPICSDDPTYGKDKVNTLIFGYTHTFWSEWKIEVRSASLTHNGVEIWSTPWLLGDLRLLNPNSWISYYSLIDSSGRVTTNLQKISTSYAPTPSYVAADGITPLLFRVGSTPEVPVTLKIASGVTNDGTLSDFYGGQTGPVSITPVMQLAPNTNYYGVGLYTAPSEFSSTASSAVSRIVQLEAEFAVRWRSAPAVLPVSFQLLRRPLLMIHGIWSSWRAWDTLAADPTVCASRLCVALDWSPADTPLPNNVGYVWNTTRSLLAGLRQANVAITQVDVIAHSAGGPLFRLYRQSGYGERVDNFFLGDFRKLLTIGSPHRGTPIANFVQELLATANPVITNLVRSAFAKSGRNVERGIIPDLQTTSPTMTGIRPTPGRAHTWIGDLPNLSASTDEKDLWTLLALICSTNDAQGLATCAGITAFERETLRARVFGGQVNDGLVAHDMQTGGVAVSAQTTLANTPHTREAQAISPVEVAGILDGISGVLDDGGLR